MNGFKKCPSGHYYQGNRCPYCPVDYSSSIMIHIDEHEGLKSRMMSIPICKHCGRPLRKGFPNPPKGMVVSSIYDIKDEIIPWNYKWDGKCEHCGFDYNIAIQTRSAGWKERVTLVWVNEKSYENYLVNDASCDQHTVLSGVNIRSDEGSVFLSTKELRYLINVLSGSPILEQFDYQEDTSCNNRHTYI